MATEKLICAICRKRVHVDPKKLEEFVPNRLWGAELKQKECDCSHESVFAEGEPIYANFLYKPGDKAMILLSKLELSKWKGKVYFHLLEEGVYGKKEFKSVIMRLLKEIDFILKNPKVENKEEKIRLLAQDKLEGYKEKVKRGKFEQERKKYIKK